MNLRARNHGSRVLMLLENNPYPQDSRVRKEAVSLQRAGFTVTVIAPRAPDQEPEEILDGIEVERFSLHAWPATWWGFVLEYLVANAQLHLRAVRRLATVDVLHLHNPPDTLFLIAGLARIAGRRVVFDQHDLGPELFAERFGAGPVTGILRVLEWLTYKVANAVLVVNDSLRQIALSRGAVDDSRVFVVRNAPPRKMSAAVRPGRSGALDQPRLIYVGSLGRQDGVDDLPEILSLLQKEQGLAGAQLTVVGDGERLDPLREKCAALELQGAVRFTGFLSEPEVASSIAQADICLEPAPCNEHNHRCSMVKVYEYMAAGRAVVSYRLREIARLGGEDIAYASCHDLRDFAAVTARLARKPEERLARGDALRRRAVEQSWEAESETLVAVYRGLAEGSAHAAGVGVGRS